MNASTFYKRHCVYLPAMAGWFICSAALTSYNKVMYGRNFEAFPCPLLVVGSHFFLQWTTSFVVSSVFPEYFGGTVVKNMSWSTFLGASIPCGLASAFDIGLASLSLVRISITFFTMVKSSFPIWILLFSFALGLEKVTCNKILVGFLISGGEFLVALGEKIAFDTIGFLLVLFGAMCGGLRWALVQLTIQNLEPPLQGPVVTMRLLSCTMFFSTILMSIAVEPWRDLGPDYFSDFYEGMRTIGIILLGGVLGIGISFFQYWLILSSNIIVMLIGYVLKDMVVILVGVTLFGDSLNAINISGIVVVNIGAVYFKVTQHLSKSKNYEIQKDDDNQSYFLCASDDNSNGEFSSADDSSARVGERSHSNPGIC